MEKAYEDQRQQQEEQRKRQEVRCSLVVNECYYSREDCVRLKEGLVKEVVGGGNW